MHTAGPQEARPWGAGEPEPLHSTLQWDLCHMRAKETSGTSAHVPTSHSRFMRFNYVSLVWREDCLRPRARLHLSYVRAVRARSGPGLGASSWDLEGSAAPQLRSEAPHRAPLELMYVKTGLPQACPVLTASAPGSLPRRAPHSPWGSGRGGAPGHRSYPAGRVCKNHSLHYLQETLSCLQTTFSSIKGCLEVSRGLSAWRRLSQRKLPCPLAEADP